MVESGGEGSALWLGVGYDELRKLDPTGTRGIPSLKTRKSRVEVTRLVGQTVLDDFVFVIVKSPEWSR